MPVQSAASGWNELVALDDNRRDLIFVEALWRVLRWSVARRWPSHGWRTFRESSRQ
jgi:hypothetical protein